MSEKVTIELEETVFHQLQRLAVPLVDTPNSVIERLIRNWQSSATRKSTERDSDIENKELLPNVWVSMRGDVLPVGPIRANYLGVTYFASIETDGIHFLERTYDSLSAAAIAVKHSAGTTGTSASTNGWEFWEIQDVRSKKWLPADAFRASTRPNTAELLSRFKAKI